MPEGDGGDGVLEVGIADGFIAFETHERDIGKAGGGHELRFVLLLPDEHDFGADFAGFSFGGEEVLDFAGSPVEHLLRAGDFAGKEGIFRVQPGDDFGGGDAQGFHTQRIERLHFLHFEGDAVAGALLGGFEAIGDGFEVAAGQEAVAGRVENGRVTGLARFQAGGGGDAGGGEDPVAFHVNRFDGKLPDALRRNDGGREQEEPERARHFS